MQNIFSVISFLNTYEYMYLENEKFIVFCMIKAHLLTE